MRGEVLHYDVEQGFGFISGADGNRYSFGRESLRRQAPMGKGTLVEFQPSQGRALDVFSIREQEGAAVPQRFGRDVGGSARASRGTGLWSYFWFCLTAGYASFRGRARRKEYWSFALFWTLAMLLLSAAGVAVDSALGNIGGGDAAAVVTVILAGGFAVLTLIPWLAVTVRRLHDIGLSGWLFLLSLIPSLGGLIIFVMTLIPSQKHENKWGPVPEGVRIQPAYVPPGYQPIPEAAPAVTPPAGT